jgi:hypothetical protein
MYQYRASKASIILGLVLMIGFTLGVRLNSFKANNAPVTEGPVVVEINLSPNAGIDDADDHPEDIVKCAYELSYGNSSYPSQKLYSNNNEQNWRETDAKLGIMVTDNNWGQTCNKVHLLAGALWRVRNEYLTTSTDRVILFLGKEISDVVLSLDLEALNTFDQRCQIRLYCLHHVQANASVCEYQISENKIIRASKKTQAQIIFEAKDLFWKFGPSKLGFMQIIAQNLIPSKSIREHVERLIQTYKGRTRGLLVGIHRRGMDQQCYQWMADPHEFDCHRSGEWLIHPMKLHRAYYQAKQASLRWKPEDLLLQNPYLAACNYTMDKTQLGLLRSNVLLNKNHQPILGILATDGQDIAGDVALRENLLFNEIFTPNSRPISNKQSCSSNPHIAMISDMYALALADLHFGNPLSSCDVLVVHWRKNLGHQINSSYPIDCYNGFYREPPR